MKSIEADVNGVMFYSSYFKAISNIPDDLVRLQAFDTIIGYMMTGKEPEEMSWMIESLFLGLKPNIDKSRQASLKGSKGGRPSNAVVESFSSFEKLNENSFSNMESQNENSFSNTESNIKEKEKEDIEENKKEDIKINSSLSLPKDDRKMFQTFWSEYPRKTRMQDTAAVWSKMNIDRDMFEQIMAGLENAKKCSQWQDKRYIPSPHLWLERGQWLDEYDDAADGSGSEFERWMEKRKKKGG